MKHGLSEKTLAELQRVLAAESGVEQAILYGSRAKGTYRHGSDIDLALTGSNLTRAALGRIVLVLDDSSLPYRCDVAILEEIENRALLDHIRRVGVPIYERAIAAAR